MFEPREVFYGELESPCGTVLVVADHVAVRQLSFQKRRGAIRVDPRWQRASGTRGAGAGGAATSSPGVTGPQLVAWAQNELGEYFAGRRRAFTFPAAPQGTPFQRKVWQALARIPYGQTVTYGRLAKRIGKPTASRAVGAANGRNPIPVVFPCHRVIGAGGQLVGFARGLDVKERLLRLESEADQTEGYHLPASRLAGSPS